jgi:dephospho-CoA kinase
MKRVGLTGGIGSGKSFVAGILRTMGYPVFHSDERAKAFTNEHPEIRKGLVARFGATIYLGEAINKPALAQRLFASEEDRMFVNALIHPIVRQDFHAWCKEQRSEMVFNEAAILFETGSYLDFDATVLVVAPLELRIARVMERNAWSAREVEERIQAQWDDARKTALASFVVVNDHQRPLLIQLEHLIDTLKA